MFAKLDVSSKNYSRPFPHFSKPRIIGYYSIDGERNYHGDTRLIKFTKSCKNETVHYDLNLKIEEAKQKKHGLKEYHLLHFLQQHELRLGLSVESTLEKSKSFLIRGLLTLIALTPYEKNEAWRIVAVLFKGNIYMCSLNTEEKMERIQNQSDKEKLCRSWGYKFEQFILSDKPDSDPNPNTPIDENEQFFLVQTMQLNRHTIFSGAEMDGIISDSDTTLPPSEEVGPENILEYLSKQTFIELKTSRQIQMPHKNHVFRRYKTKKWFCQCFVANIDRILCGFRNEDGIVQELKLYHLQDLVQMSQRFWSPNVMYNFLDTLLTYVKRCLEIEIRSKHGDEGLKNLLHLPLIALQFEWSPNRPVTVTDGYNYDDDPRLPTWFTDHYGKA